MEQDNTDQRKFITSTSNKISIPMTDTHNSQIEDSNIKTDKTTTMRTRRDYSVPNLQNDDNSIKVPKTHKRCKNIDKGKRYGVRKSRHNSSRIAQKRTESKKFSYMDGVLTGVLIGSIGATILGFPH